MAIGVYPPEPIRTVRRGTATVQSIVSDGSLIVRIGGGDDATNDVVAERLASYERPAVGDSVGLLTDGDSRLVVGRIATTAPAPIVEPPGPGVRSVDDTNRVITTTTYVDFAEAAVRVSARTGSAAKLLIGHACRLLTLGNSTLANTVFQTFGITDEAGNTVTTPSDVNSVRITAHESRTMVASYGWSTIFASLQAHTTYVLTLYARRTESVGSSVQDRRLWVVPLDR